MKNTFYILSIATLIFSCSTENEEEIIASDKEPNEIVLEDIIIGMDQDPKELLKEAYQEFKEGNDEESIKLANKVLEYGRAVNDDTLVGGALSSLCRNAQRTLDTIRLAELSIELAELSESSGDQKWMMKRAHMNAEMWRLIGNMEKAEAFYIESMAISKSIGAMGMFTIDHFNKSFVSTETGDFVEARRLITKYYALRQEADSTSEDAYGLIALAYLLEQEGDLEGAFEVATVTRRLFKEQNIFPEPPDEKPLISVEISILHKLESDKIKTIGNESLNKSVNNLLTKHLK
jgi:tetratricopeptide (TPR) repeat protein